MMHHIMKAAADLSLHWGSLDPPRNRLAHGLAGMGVGCTPRQTKKTLSRCTWTCLECTSGDICILTIFMCTWNPRVQSGCRPRCRPCRRSPLRILMLHHSRSLAFTSSRLLSFFSFLFSSLLSIPFSSLLLSSLFLSRFTLLV